MKLSVSKIIGSLVNNSVEVATGLGTIILVSRLFSQQQVGAWVLFMTIFMFSNQIREGVVQSALVKYSVGVGKSSRRKVLKASFIINLLLEVLLTILIVGIALLELWPGEDGLLIYYPLYSLPWAFYRWQLFVHRSELAVGFIFKTNLIVFVSLLAGGLLLWWNQWEISRLPLILGFGSLNAALVGLAHVEIFKVLKSPMDRGVYRRLLSFGKHGILREFAGTLSNRINIFLTAGWLSLSDTALLGVAEKFTQLLIIPNAAIQALIFPLAVQRYQQTAQRSKRLELKKLFEESTAMLLAFFIPLILLMWTCSGLLLKVVNGKEYLAAAPLMGLMLITTGIFLPLGNSFGTMMNVLGQPRWNTLLVSVNSLINIGISWFCVTTFGLIGAVVGPLLTESLGLLWMSLILKKELSTSPLQAVARIPQQYVKLYQLLRKGLRMQPEKNF